MTLTLSGYQDYAIKAITLSMKSNSSKGAGNYSATIGNKTISTISTANFNDASWYGAWSTSYVDVTPTISENNQKIVVGEDENVVLQIAATVNSLYCQSFKIEYVKNHTITFNSNEGSSVESKNVLDGQKINQPSNPTRDGYIFDGWFIDDGIWTNAFDFNNAINSDITLYAKWNPAGTMYNITDSILNGNLSSVESVPENSALNITINPDSDHNRPVTLNVTMGGSKLANGIGYTYNSLNGAFSIPSITGDVIISGTCVADSVYQNAVNSIKSYRKLAYSYTVYTMDVPNVRYVKVSSKSEMTSGKYLIVNEENSVALNANLGDVAKNKIDVSIVSFSISANENTINAELDYNSADGTFETINDGYIYHTGSKNTLNFTETKEDAENDISFSEGNAIIKIDNYNIRYNSAADQERFRYYTSESNVQLYKKVIETEYYDDSMSFQLYAGIDDSIENLNGVIGTSEYVWGIAIKQGETEFVKFDSKHYDAENHIKYLTLELGKLLENKERAAVDFTIEAYIEVCGKTYYSDYINLHTSINELLAYYKTLDDATVPSSYKDMITELQASLA